EEGGRAFLAMEYVRGEPLSATVPSEGLPGETVLRYGAQIADALAHAHEHGVLHRDLKGSNVLITPEGRPKVLDFGLAKLAVCRGGWAGDSTVSDELTAKGTILGTYPYMAPEVFRGETADARADVWALGVMLYHAAGGKLPFRGKTSTEVGAAVRRAAPAPLGPQVPGGLWAVIHGCLMKEPSQRYQSAAEVRAALELLREVSSRSAVTVKAAPERDRRWVWAVV